MNKKRKAARKLVLHQETLARLSSPKLDKIAGGAPGGAGPQVRTIAEFSGGPVCTGGIACTFNWTCSHGCQ